MCTISVMIVIRAKLNHQKRIYRDIVISPESSLYDLAEVVIDAFGFDFDHCFGFFASPDIFGRGKESLHYELFYDIDEEIDELTESVEQTQLDKLFKQPKDKWWMLFDYGDEWIFELVYQKQSPPLFADRPDGSIVDTQGESPQQYPNLD